MIKIIALCACLFVFGCASPSVIKTTADGAKNTVDVIVKDKPECKSVGDVCKQEIDNLSAVCNQSVEKAKNDGFDKGFNRGVIVSAIFAILAFVALKKVL